MIKKIIITFFSTFLITALLLFIIFSPADVIRMYQEIDLKKEGIKLNYSYVPEGLYQKPFIINFSGMLSSLSNGRIRVQAINTYTLGNYDKISPDSIGSVTNLLDPKSKFKDTWFGVYIIFDDSMLKGRRFMLIDPDGSPEDLDNFNIESMVELPRIDQKLIVYSTHQGQKNYRWNDYNKEFYFNIREGLELQKEIITDKKGMSWRKVTSEFDTIAVLTDTGKTDMKIFRSIRGFVGLPNDEVYSHVDPWHPIIIKGSVLGKYFNCGKIKYWAVVYYNGSAFYNKKGEFIDNWENTDLKTVLEKMFNSLEIGCI